MKRMFPQLTHRIAGQSRVQIIAWGLVLAMLIGATALHSAYERVRTADRLFERMVATDELPWDVPVSRITARAIVDRYPDSRWASEAWRVIALDAESRCDTEAAIAAWSSFTGAFIDARGPGAAMGHRNVARLHESGGSMRAADHHYRTAIRAVNSDKSGVQVWIAVDAARSVARIKRASREWAETTAWEMRADSLARIHQHRYKGEHQ